MSDQNKEANATLQERTLETIKQAHDIIESLNIEAKEANVKVAAAEADATAAEPIADQIIEKLATVQIDGELIVAPHLRDDFRKVMSSKEGMADLMNQLTDILVNNSSDSEDKTASELGGAAASPNAYGDDLASGSGALPSRIRM